MPQNEPSAEAVKVTQADIRAALAYLGWDDYDDFCEWAVSNHEMDRFDELAKAFARHRAAHESTLRQHAERLAVKAEVLLSEVDLEKHDAGGWLDGPIHSYEFEDLAEAVASYRADYPKDESNG
jgi:hypothetical protein